MTSSPAPSRPLRAGDFASDQQVRWCPGCGAYFVLARLRQVLARAGARPEKTVFVSGIGCSSRFPYYMNAYGFHTIHGRAPTVATGLKLARPDLDVWITTGDGDALSIGGNHLLHTLRRNVDVKILLFNNATYAMTKGQPSPTSTARRQTENAPGQQAESPINPLALALTTDATFVARCLDRDIDNLDRVLERAARHRGAAFVQIDFTCVVFNRLAFAHLADKADRDERVLHIEHGRPMVFGRQRDKGISLVGCAPQVISLQDGRADELIVHDEQAEDPAVALMLSRMNNPPFPELMGVLRCVQRPCFDGWSHEQTGQVVSAEGPDDFSRLLAGTEAWVVE